MRYLDRILDEDDTPLRWISERLATAEEFTAVVGYLDRGGVQLVESSLRALLDRGGSVRIVVNKAKDRPRPSDLTWLLELFAAHGERAVVLLAHDDTILHSKVFFTRDSAGMHALVGSANFTRAGLTHNWEAAVALVPSDEEALHRIEEATRAWAKNPHVAPIDLGMVASFDVRATPAGTNMPLHDLLQPALDEIEAFGASGGVMNGLPTGFHDLDRLLNGLRPGQMVIVAGRPGIGKSTLALDIARATAITHGRGALYLSFEMSAIEMTQRMLSAEARVPLHILLSGQLSDDDWTKLARRLGDIQTAPLNFNDSCTPSIRSIAEAVQKAVTEDDVKLIVIDYLQLLYLDRRAENRQQETAEISRKLKGLARALGVPIIVVSQLNRAPEARMDKRPQLSDLRDSGGLEQDADIVIMIHRDDYYDRESLRAGEADFIVAKHRNGPTDTVTVAAQLHLSRFVDMAI